MFSQQRNLHAAISSFFSVIVQMRGFNLASKADIFWARHALFQRGGVDCVTTSALE